MLRAEALPALLAAALQHEAPALGAHPFPESVLTLALEIAGLEGTFHGLSISLV